MSALRSLLVVATLAGLLPAASPLLKTELMRGAIGAGCCEVGMRSDE